MAPKDTDEVNKSTPKAGQGEEKDRSLKDVASDFIDEVERTGSALIDEIRHLFDSLSSKVSGVAGAAVDTTTALAEKVGKEPAHFIGNLLKEVQEAGEASVKAIGTSFEALRDRVVTHAGEQAPDEVGKKADEAAVERKAAKKKVSTKKPAKKSAASRATTAPVTKKTTTKKAVSKQKALPKKATTKKKVATKKKGVSRKAPAAGGGGSG